MITGFWTTFALFGLVLQVVVHFWPLSLLLGVNAVVAVFYSTPSRRLLALVVPFIWPVLIIFVAGSGWQFGSQAIASSIPVVGIGILFCIQIILSFGLIYQLRGRRWAATAVCLVAGWFGLISWFIAGMALTNLWL